jgi:hypothetical protein
MGGGGCNTQWERPLCFWVGRRFFPISMSDVDKMNRNESRMVHIVKGMSIHHLTGQHTHNNVNKTYSMWRTRRTAEALFTSSCRLSVGMQWRRSAWTVILRRCINCWGHEADHSSASSAEVKNVWSYTSTPLYVSTAWGLVKHRDTFYLILSVSNAEVTYSLSVICRTSLCV